MRGIMTRPSSPSINYVKGEGCGNTFLIFDFLDNALKVSQNVLMSAHTALLQEKRDDALILQKEYEDADQLILKMIVLEPDQSIAEFCGNGARVVSCYLQMKYGLTKKSIFLQTTRGKRKIWWQDDNYFVDMGKTVLHFRESKFFAPQLKNMILGLGFRQFSFFWTETMEPHLVTFDAISEEELQTLGMYLNLQQRELFPLGANVNKVEVIDHEHLKVTTFERGVNRITNACGTGSTSSVMLAKELGHVQTSGNISVETKGGTIMVQPRKKRAIMYGPATIDL